jgi:hypothetical protein
MGEPIHFEQYKDLTDEAVAELLQYEIKDCLTQAQRYWRRSMGHDSSHLPFTNRVSNRVSESEESIQPSKA